MTTATLKQQKPKSFFDERIAQLKVRINNLRHFLQKESDPKKAKAIEHELEQTSTTLKRTELDSNFASLDNEI